MVESPTSSPADFSTWDDNGGGAGLVKANFGFRGKDPTHLNPTLIKDIKSKKLMMMSRVDEPRKNWL